MKNIFLGIGVALVTYITAFAATTVISWILSSLFAADYSVIRHGMLDVPDGPNAVGSYLRFYIYGVFFPIIAGALVGGGVGAYCVTKETRDTAPVATFAVSLLISIFLAVRFWNPAHVVYSIITCVALLIAVVNMCVVVSSGSSSHAPRFKA